MLPFIFKPFIFTYNMVKKKAYKSISIVLDPVLIEKLEIGKYNKSKLIDSLLDSYFKKQKNKSS